MLYVNTDISRNQIIHNKTKQKYTNKTNCVSNKSHGYSLFGYNISRANVRLFIALKRHMIHRHNTIIDGKKINNEKELKVFISKSFWKII